MLKSRKHVFWEALLVAILVFGLGIILGVYLEQIRTDQADLIYYQSEVSLFDSLAWINLMDSLEFSSAELVQANLDFADKIYDEARSLEKFDDANKVTQSLKMVHRKYDLQRTVLWMNTIKLKQRASGINDLVYFYIYDTEDIELKAKQIVFSRVLGDLKQKKGNDFVLIPIAVDSDIASLNYLLDFYNVEIFPSILVNEETLITEVPTVGELEAHLT